MTISIANRTIAATLVVVLSVSAALAGQAPPQPRYHFEVASIRPSTAANNSNRTETTPQGGLRAVNVTTLQLIARAFGVRPFLVVDAPAWVSSSRFDIQATPDAAEGVPASAIEGAAMQDRSLQRIQSLLVNRFGLVIRTESRPMPVYKLVLPQAGHKMAAAASSEARRMESNSTMLRRTAVDMKTLADAMSGILLQPVIDDTGLPGAFNFGLQFADVRLQATTTDPGSLPTIFTAITEQLGLRLESGRAAVPVFVVESIRLPSEN